MKKILLPLAAFTLISVTANAEEDYKFKDGVTVLQLSESASTKAEEDRLRATLKVEFRSSNTRNVQSKVNVLMSDAVNAAEKYKQLKVTTGGYNVQRNYYSNDSKRLKKPEWVATQSLTIDGEDSETLLNLVGTLQKRGLMLNSLNYYLSREKAATYKDELIAKALVLVKQRANSIGNQLGASKVHFANINVNSNSRPPQMHRMEMMASASMDKSAMPVAKSGEQDVSVNVNVTVELVD